LESISFLELVVDWQAGKTNGDPDRFGPMTHAIGTKNRHPCIGGLGQQATASQLLEG